MESILAILFYPIILILIAIHLIGAAAAALLRRETGRPAVGRLIARFWDGLK